METACQTQATTRKFAHQIMSAKATTTPRFDPSQLRQKKSGDRIPTAALKFSNLSEQKATMICI
jgi:hypothetical protein